RVEVAARHLAEGVEACEQREPERERDDEQHRDRLPVRAHDGERAAEHEDEGSEELCCELPGGSHGRLLFVVRGKSPVTFGTSRAVSSARGARWEARGVLIESLSPGSKIALGVVGLA